MNKSTDHNVDADRNGTADIFEKKLGLNSIKQLITAIPTGILVSGVISITVVLTITIGILLYGNTSDSQIAGNSSQQKNSFSYSNNTVPASFNPELKHSITSGPLLGTKKYTMVNGHTKIFSNNIQISQTGISHNSSDKEQVNILKQKNIKITPLKLRLTMSKSETIQFPRPYDTALISNEKIADVVPLSDSSIYILGKKTGTTRLTVLDKSKSILGIVEIEVTYDLTLMQTELKRLLPASNIKVRSLNGNVLLTGSVPDAITLNKAISFARRFAPDGITNAVKVASPQQVMLEVRFIEANRQAAKELGIGWNVIANKFIGSTLLANPVSSLANAGTQALAGGQTFGTAVASFLAKGTSVDVMIKAMEKRNVARRLAEPNLVALSGDTAHFLAGGEFPFAVIGPNQTTGTQFRKFGISLEFTPTVLENGLINLKIEPEVSEIGPTLVELGPGSKAPSLLVRKVKTTVELRDGQSFAIAGLLQSTDYKVKDQLPWIGDLPILGTLFRSSAFQRKETDLVIIITPRLVQPAAPTQKLSTPLDDTMASNDIEFFLGGKDEIRVQSKDQLARTGHIVDTGKKKSETKPAGKTNTVSHSINNNKTIHTVTPWPAYVQNTDIEVEGVRSMGTIEKYHQADKSFYQGKKKAAEKKEQVSDFDETMQKH
ncbi:MAG: type II and III secretion system protein family protein [Methyloligellaceae bacterium]